MDIQFFGANCLVFNDKSFRLVVDDNLADLGLKSMTKEGDLALFTTPHAAPSPSVKIVIDGPGEYEVAGVFVYGIAARSHMDEEGKASSTLYKLVLDDLNILVTGHVYPELDDSQLEAIGMIDIMFVPVGGNGYTLDGIGALKLVKKISPKIVVPTHYDDPSIRFEVPQQPLDEALKVLSMDVKETTLKLRPKHGELSDSTQLIVLEKP